MNEDGSRLTGNDKRLPPVARLLAKMLALAAGGVLLVVALMFSVLLFALLAAAGLLAWGYLWWKTRKLRKHLREQPPGGHVIEGEVVRNVDGHDKLQR